jgi:hypothetical protein
MVDDISPELIINDRGVKITLDFGNNNDNV